MLAHTIRHVTKMTTRFINAFLNYYFFFFYIRHGCRDKRQQQAIEQYSTTLLLEANRRDII